MTVFTKSEFAEHPDRAMNAASEGPVFITDSDGPQHVVLSIDDYQRMAGRPQSIVEALSMPEAADIDIEFPRVEFASRPFDFNFD
jgi:PHD/YefM family antitoxin component YafN of YafNO toxin-antitoxin module